MQDNKPIGNKLADACIFENPEIEPAKRKKYACELIQKEISQMPIDELAQYFEDAVLIKSELKFKVTFSFPLKFKDLT